MESLKKNPITLPGKELYSIHFDPILCSVTKEEIQRIELEPLFSLMEEKRIIPSGKGEELLNSLLKTMDTTEVWEKEKGSSWHLKINKNSPDESGAFSGWYVLYHLHTAREIWKGFRRPYHNLTHAHMNLKSKLLLASILCKVFEKNEPEETKEIQRHFLALLLVIKNNEDELNSLNKETLGSATFTKHDIPKQLIVSHGIPSGEKWIRPNLKTIKLLTEKLEQTLTKTQKDELNHYRI